MNNSRRTSLMIDILDRLVMQPSRIGEIYDAITEDISQEELRGIINSLATAGFINYVGETHARTYFITELGEKQIGVYQEWLENL